MFLVKQRDYRLILLKQGKLVVFKSGKCYTKL